MIFFANVNFFTVCEDIIGEWILKADKTESRTPPPDPVPFTWNPLITLGLAIFQILKETTEKKYTCIISLGDIFNRNKRILLEETLICHLA